MAKREVFVNIYEQITGWRFVAIAVLMSIGVGVLYYFNQLGKEVEEREKKYVLLYAAGIKFFVEMSVESTCDYTFVQEVLEANETVPAIVVQNGVPIANINIPEFKDSTRTWKPKEQERILYTKISEMGNEHQPIEFSIGKDKVSLYYSNSVLAKQLRYFPYILLGTFLIFGSLAFIAYSSSRKAEQNRVWVGLAKETAHQLGTPISALMAWVEVLRSDPSFDATIGDEMEKDVKRLETITTRFSNIGSVPQMSEEQISPLIYQTLHYLERRISTKIKVHFDSQISDEVQVSLNKHLLEWVVENLCKNAVDAMGGVGDLYVTLTHAGRRKIAIDVRDTGKGISKTNIRKVFKPGFSTKKRGWGLGLTLAKRIIENYHDGKLFVKETQVDKGTTFRIVLDTV
ncbi:integral membrane sensor signal transduction histidine kinase [Emticicia oligotrophica DSM 17448]|uniref:histidine kinase n=1 Tax=Emticicia oligotrophica (strain DSM 17448 / CIP 109782 / MTCC 6937 / GPTSA100-15) TaxID=929562 RepID=A0ABM5N251_EMTOG|nr:MULTISPECIES: HAMP domain-containing sensor histidine kinase [Emticicia]AFK03469.1 integral membrane sensor signal transduction histidine kinase [Emticicia oligotrophica DSM 17448]